MNGSGCNPWYIDPTGVRPTNTIRKIMVVAVVFMLMSPIVTVTVIVIMIGIKRGLGIVMQRLGVSGVAFMNEAQALKQPMRRGWHPNGSQDQRKDGPDSTQLPPQ